MNARTAPIALTLLCLPLLAARPLAARPLAVFRDALHGTWMATVTPDDMAAGKEHKDVLTFALGDRFGSEEQAKLGYEAAPYDDRGSPIGAAATFDVTLKTKAGDTAHWQGSVAGGEMTGTLLVTPKGGAAVSYSFKAEKK